MHHFINHFFETNRQRLPLFVPIAFGSGAGWYFALTHEPTWWFPALVLLISLACGWAFRRQVLLLFVCVYLAACAAGFINAGFYTHRMHSPVLEDALFWKEVRGHIDAIDIDETSNKVTLSNPQIEGLPPERTPKKVRITFKNPDNHVRVGDDIRVKATLFPLPTPVAPGAFDFGRYLYFQGLGAVGYTTRNAEVLHHKASISDSIEQFRVAFATDMITSMHPPYGAIAAAISVGEQKAVPEPINDLLRDSGLYHILSISGVHMSIAAGLIFYFVRLLLALWPYAALHWPIKKIAALLALASSFCYLLAAGSPVPAVRSFIMVAVVFTAVLCDRKGISMVALAWAALLILLLQPDAVISASFQLSFAATVAIIALYERYGSVLYRPGAGVLKRMGVAVLATIIVSLVATLATAPFVITHFNRLQLWGMLANALVTPLTAFLIMPSVVMGFLLYPFGAQHLAYIPLEWGMRAMVWVGAQVAALPHASIYLPSFTTTGFVVAFIGLYVFLLLTSNARRLGLAMIAFGVGSMAFTTSPDMLIAEGGKIIAVKDAGQHLVMLKGRNSSFTAEQWAKANSQKLPLNLEEAVWSADTQAECSKDYCIYQRARVVSVFVFNPYVTGNLCDAVMPRLLTTRFYVYDDECTQVNLIIDRDRLSTSGAMDVRITKDDILLRHAADIRGTRPWVAK